MKDRKTFFQKFIEGNSGNQRANKPSGHTSPKSEVKAHDAREGYPKSETT